MEESAAVVFFLRVFVTCFLDSPTPSEISDKNSDNTTMVTKSGAFNLYNLFLGLCIYVEIFLFYKKKERKGILVHFGLFSSLC